MKYLAFLFVCIALLACNKEEECMDVERSYSGYAHLQEWEHFGYSSNQTQDTIYSYSLIVTRENDSLTFWREPYYTGTYYYPLSEIGNEAEVSDNNFYGLVKFRLFDSDSISYSLLQAGTNNTRLFSFKGVAQP